MESPLFGEESPRDKAIQYVFGGLLVIGVVLTLIFSFVNGVTKTPTHIVFGISIVFSLAILIVLWQWYRVGDLDPKFKYLIGAIIVNLILLIVVANIYFWEPEPEPLCPGQFLEVSTGACFSYCGPSQCDYQTVYIEGKCYGNCTTSGGGTRSPFYY